MLRTARLVLRPVPAEAASALPGDRGGAGRVLGFELAAGWPGSDVHGHLLRQALADAGLEPFGIWVIVEHESSTVVGDIGFKGPPGTDRTVEIGYSVVPDRRGRGYAAEAAAAIVNWALGQTDVDVVVAGCDAGNAASIRTLERVGFVRTGVSDGEIRWRFQPPSGPPE